MRAIASQIPGVSIIFSTVCSGADDGKDKAPRHWPLWGEFTTQSASNAENVSTWWRHDNHVGIYWNWKSSLWRHFRYCKSHNYTDKQKCLLGKFSPSAALEVNNFQFVQETFMFLCFL